MTGPAEDPSRPDEATTRQSIADEVRGLIAAARARIETELAFQKARAALAGKWAGTAAALGCAGLALLFLALLAAMFGLVLALAQTLGAWAATGIVAGGFLLAAVVVLLLAWRWIGRLRGLLREDRP